MDACTDAQFIVLPLVDSVLDLRAPSSLSFRFYFCTCRISGMETARFSLMGQSCLKYMPSNKWSAPSTLANLKFKLSISLNSYLDQVTCSATLLILTPADWSLGKRSSHHSSTVLISHTLTFWFLQWILLDMASSWRNFWQSTGPLCIPVQLVLAR